MKEFDFDSVGKRLPYNVPEGFFEGAKSKARAIGTKRERVGISLFYQIAVAAAVVLAICGAAICLEEFNSPESKYERMLADVSSDVLWEYACEYDTTDGEYLY